MKSKSLPSQEYLQECFVYDPRTGLLFWKERPISHFKNERVWKIWNTRFSGELALNYVIKGYKVGHLNGSQVRSHRVIYKLIHGADPYLILHSSGEGLDNRIEMVSSGSHSDNGKDMKKSIANASGITGVGWYKSRNQWRAKIGVNRKTKHLGYYEDFFEACCARKSAEVKFGYHPNHGKR